MTEQQKQNDIQDRLNKLRGQQKEIEAQNKKLKHDRGVSVFNIGVYNKKIEAEAVAIRYYDHKVDENMDKYYRLSDEIKVLQQLSGKQK